MSNPFYGTMGSPLPPPGLSETDLDAWRTGGGVGTEDPSHSDWVTIGGQRYYRIGDPSQLDNTWVPPGVKSQVTYDPARGYLLPESAAEQYLGGIRAISAANDDSRMMWGLGAGLMGGLPMAAHGAFGSALQGMTGGVSEAGGAFGSSGLTEGALASESGFVPGSFELGTGTGLGGEAAWGVSPRGEDMGFFDDILDWGTNEESLLDGWGTNELDLPGGGGGDELPGGFGQSSWFDSLVNGLTPSSSTASSLLRMLMGTNAQGGTRGIGDLFGSNGLLGTAASVAPSLAAISYARGLPDPDTSRLESAYSSISPSSLAMPYDIQTGRGRESLDSSLTRRGVMGSSFANQDTSSYDTLRGLGRSNLLTSGATSQANIAKQILDAQNAAQGNRTELYGRALLALSGSLNPSYADQLLRNQRVASQ